MNKRYFGMILFLFSFNLSAQNKICFSSYDGSGNRKTYLLD